MRLLPHQQQLQPNDSANGLRKLGMPPDEVAADKQPSALVRRAGLCSGELLGVP